MDQRDDVALADDRGPVQRALLHQWQTGAYLLLCAGLILGLYPVLGIAGGHLLVVGFSLLLLAPLALALHALRGRRYHHAAMMSAVSGSLSLFGALVLLPLQAGYGLAAGAAGLGALGYLAIYGAVALVLAGVAAEGIGCHRTLRTRVQGRRRLAGHRPAPMLPS